MSIRFYREREEPYGSFSNFANYSFEINGMPWQTVEHYFQAMKFPGTPHEEAIRLAPAPMIAKQMGNDRAFPLRSDWEEVKDGHDAPGRPGEVSAALRPPGLAARHGPGRIDRSGSQ